MIKKTIPGNLRKFAVLLFSAGSLQLFAQAVTPAPIGTNEGTTAPHDYGKDVYSTKIKKRIISFGFFSPLNQHISFGYDQLMGTDMVFTSQLGIIGPGINNNNYGYYPANPRGAFAEVGIKLFFSPDFVTDGVHRYNRMQGGYFKPQLVVSSFDLTNYRGGYNQPVVATPVNYTGVAVLLNYGKQWILANSVSLDLYGGIGYSLNAMNNTEYVSNYYSYESTGSTLPLAITGGLNIGLPF